MCIYTDKRGVRKKEKERERVEEVVHRSMQEKEREEKGRKKKRQESEGRIPERGLRDQVMLTGARSSHTYLLISARTQLHVRARRGCVSGRHARHRQTRGWIRGNARGTTNRRRGGLPLRNRFAASANRLKNNKTKTRISRSKRGTGKRERGKTGETRARVRASFSARR